MKIIYAALASLAVLLALCATALAGGAANTDPDKIDEYVSQQMKDGQIPGMAVGIVENGEITYLKGYGMADDKGATVTPQTPFTMGSIGKTFTALAVRQMANQGRIDYNAPVQTYIPWFTLADSKTAAQIRIIDLIGHRSGLSGDAGVSPALYNSTSIEQAVKSLGSVAPDRPAGSSEEYSNANYIILGLVIEKVSGMKYEEYILQNIIEPLELQHTYPSVAMTGKDVMAQGHYVMYGLTVPNNEPLPQGMIPAGFQVTCAEDLAKYASLYLNNGYHKGVSIIPDNTLPERNASEDYKPEMERYNAYWVTETGDVQGYVGYYGHAGATNGFTSIILINPVQKKAIVVLANCRNTACYPEISAQTIGNGIASLFDRGVLPINFQHSIPGLWINILVAAVILAALLFRAVWTHRFRGSIRKGGAKRVWALVSFAVLDLLLPILILAGIPLYMACTWLYLLNTNMDLWVSIFTAAILLAGIGVTKLILLCIPNHGKGAANA